MDNPPLMLIVWRGESRVTLPIKSPDPVSALRRVANIIEMEDDHYKPDVHQIDCIYADTEDLCWSIIFGEDE